MKVNAMQQKQEYRELKYYWLRMGRKRVGDKLQFLLDEYMYIMLDITIADLQVRYDKVLIN